MTQNLGVDGFTEAEVAKALHSMRRIVAFKYELLDLENRHSGWLNSAAPGSLSHNALAHIKRTANFTLKDTGDINWLSDRIRPWFRLAMPPARETVAVDVEPPTYKEVVLADVPHGFWRLGEASDEPPVTEKYADVVLADGPNGYWRLGERTGTVAADSSMSGIDGTYVGSPKLDAEGAIAEDSDASMQLDGKPADATTGTTADYVNLGNPAQLQATGDQTIEMWIRPSDFAARRNPWNKDYAREGAITQETNGQLNYYFGNGTSYVASSAPAIIQLNTWHHVVHVRDLTNGRLRWYIDGVKQTDVATTMTAVVSTAEAWIGEGYVEEYAGRIDEVAHYAKALTDAQIKRHYDVGIGRKYGIKSGSVADSSGHDLHGIYQNGVRSTNGVVVKDSDAAARITDDSQRWQVDLSASGIETGGVHPFTLEAWSSWSGNIDSASRKDGVILVGENLDSLDRPGASEWAPWFAHLNGKWRAWWRIVGNWTSIDSLATYGVDDVAHLAITYDGTTVRFYVNGELQGTNTNKPVHCRSLAIQRGISSSKLYGVDDEVALYDHTLSAESVKRHYEAGLARYKPQEFRARKLERWAEWPMGLFLPSSPKRDISSTGATRSVEAYDQGVILRNDKVEDRFTVAAGTNVITAVKDILTGVGITQFAMESSAETLPVARDWKPGTDKNIIVNDLLDSIGFTTLSFSSFGAAVAMPYRSPAARPLGYRYASDDRSVLVPDMTHELDLFDIPNKWVLVVSEPDRPELVSTFTNTNEDSPTSTVNRGRTIVDFREDVEATSQESLDAQAVRLAVEASQVYEAVEFRTGLMPHHEDAEVLELVHATLGDVARYVEHTWDMRLEAGEKMAHRVRRVVDVS